MISYNNTLQQLTENHNYRSLPKIEAEEMVDLCSNDYLGITGNAELRAEFLTKHTDIPEFGAMSSRLLGSTKPFHVAFEQTLAEAYQKERALLFNSGYHANVGTLSCLAQKGDLILADKSIHASVIDGAKLSDADFKRFKHNNYDHLQRTLEKYRAEYNRVFIVVESIYSMEGDLAQLPELVRIKQQYNCFLYVDEAHALGVRGATGLGMTEEFNVVHDVDFIVGTMGKAMASVGAFVVCNHVLAEMLINHSRSFIYSTALPPINVAWSLFVFKKMRSMQREREHLSILSKQLIAKLDSNSQSHIVQYRVESNAKAIELSEQIRSKGFNVLPIRYPTVPKNEICLRFSLNAGLTEEQLNLITVVSD